MSNKEQQQINPKLLELARRVIKLEQTLSITLDYLISVKASINDMIQEEQRLIETEEKLVESEKLKDKGAKQK